MKIEVMNSNSVEVDLGETSFLFSYGLMVAVFVSGKGFSKVGGPYSTTTSKHVNTWLRKNGVSPKEAPVLDEGIVALAVDEAESAFFAEMLGVK